MQFALLHGRWLLFTVRLVLACYVTRWSVLYQSASICYTWTRTACNHAYAPWPAAVAHHTTLLTSILDMLTVFAVDEDFPPLGSARQTSISSLPSVAQGDTTRRSTPSLPPGLEDAVPPRRGTSTIPPGLVRTVIDAGLSSSPSTTDNSKSTALNISDSRRVGSAQIVPMVPLGIHTPVGQTPRPATPRASTVEKANSASIAESRLSALDDKTISSPKLERPDTDEHGSSEDVKAMSTRHTNTAEERKARMADISNLDGNAATSQSITTAIGPEPKVKGRKHPGTLDISAAAVAPSDSAIASTLKASATPNTMEQSNIELPIPPSPSTPDVSSPAGKAGPSTLRVVQTRKTETLPSVNANPTTPAPVLATTLATASRKLPSRQPSIASMNMPGTPSSEHVSLSDNVSIPSTSQSRANSPPPVSKVGSAPVRAKTKSQLKKERQERAKAIEENKVSVEDDVKVVTAEEPAQEAIVSRKKKTKKDKEVRIRAKPLKEDHAASSEVAISRPVSPTAATQEAISRADEPGPTPPPPPTKAVSAEPSPPLTPTFSPAQFIAELRATDATIARSLDALCRVPAANSKGTPTIISDDLQDPASWQMPDYNIKLTREEIDSLLNGGRETVAWDTGNGRIWSRTLITPGGAQLRALSEEQERRFTELEKSIMDLPEELRFRPTKPQNETSFPAFDLRAIKKGFDSNGTRSISVMEQMVQDGNAMKKGAFLVDEASKYINEFVMPPATPPQSAGIGTSNVSQQVHGQASGGSNAQHEQPGQSLEIIERQLQEAKKAVDEREGALRRAIRKNKKLLGLG